MEKKEKPTEGKCLQNIKHEKENFHHPLGTNILDNKKDIENLLDKELMEKNKKRDSADPEITKNGEGKIIFSKIEDIPTRPDSPKAIENEKRDQLVPVNDICEGKKINTSTRLKFEINIPQKRVSMTTPSQSTFAELSNKLGPTVNFNNRKIGINPNIKNPLLEPKITENKKEDKKQMVKVKETKTIQGAELVHIDNDETEEVVFLKTSKSRSKSRSRDNRRSKSRSYTYSRSRSRSYSHSSYSRSRSRSYSYSRSRSYSSYSSRSRSRSPSIQRRRGSPSFLDKRRITSARKRPIPYHRPTPSPTPSYSSSSSYSRSPSRSRGMDRSRSRSKITK